MSKSRGGRPRDEARRNAALEAARELLVAKGYDELTLAEVARVAGVSRPFVYDNWGSKFALVEDAIFVTDGQRLDIDDDTPIAEALTKLIAAMVSVHSHPAYLAGVPGLSAEMYNKPDLVDQIETKYMAPVRRLYVRLIERGKAEGVVRADVDGSALMDTLRGAVMLHTLINPALNELALIDHLRQIVFNGIAER